MLSAEFSLRPITNRGFDEYLGWFNLNPPELRGRVLDLGSGLGRFPFEAKLKGVDIVSL